MSDSRVEPGRTVSVALLVATLVSVSAKSANTGQSRSLISWLLSWNRRLSVGLHLSSRCSCGYTSGHNVGDTLCRLLQQLDPGFVLPYPYRQPAHFSQSFVDLTVPLLVSRNLSCPEFGVGFGRSSVDRASMPEASIYEDSHLRLDKQDVRGSRQLFHRL